MTQKTPWNAIGQRQENSEGSAWLEARPMKVLRGCPSAMRADWMTSMAWTSSETARNGSLITYASIVRLEAFGLPHRNLDRLQRRHVNPYGLLLTAQVLIPLPMPLTILEMIIWTLSYAAACSMVPTTIIHVPHIKLPLRPNLSAPRKAIMQPTKQPIS